MVPSTQGYLEKFYGYRPPGWDRQRRAADSPGAAEDRLCATVRQMQRYFGLPADGRLTPDTLALMRKPRCGLSDVEPFSKTWRWKRRTLSYRFDRGPLFTHTAAILLTLAECAISLGE